MNNAEGPVIPKEQIRKGINSLRPGRAPGDNDLSTEMLQAKDEIGIEIITELFNKIYDSGYIPGDLKINIHSFFPRNQGFELHRFSNH